MQAAQAGADLRAVVLGASGALGSALVALLKADARFAHVIALSRSSDPAFSLEDEASIQRCAQQVAQSGAVHWVIDATGALEIDGRSPEKRLDALSAAALTRAFEVNAIGPALLMKHFIPLLSTDQPTVFATLSARVGSIADNRKGGWYGYRAAKAARNMLLQTAAIEAHRRRPLAVFAALQPGTVRSRLSQAFVSPEHALHPLVSAANLLAVLGQLRPTGRAQFVDYQGAAIAW
jgi:NAD(P)-dependent dehydrogenase (short-subunit alcohol dehydrogenase family)